MPTPPASAPRTHSLTADAPLLSSAQAGLGALLSELLANKEAAASRELQEFLQLPPRYLEHQSTNGGQVAKTEDLCVGCKVDVILTLLIVFGAGATAPSCTGWPLFTAEAGYR